jgi:signal transduction histidine kinase
VSSNRIEQLKEIAEQMDSAKDPQAQISLLTKGFELFSEETARLDAAYGELRQQFRAVNKKLEETNSRLSNKVQELHVLTSYLDNILSHMSQGLLFIDIEGNLTTYNQSAESILEKPRNEVLFQPFKEHFNDTILGFSIQSALSEKQAPRHSYATITFPDGKKRELEIETTFLLQKPSNSPELDFTQGIIILLRDISELRTLQVIASRHDRMQALGEMAAQVAHEIRNPLGGIKGFASLLTRDLKDEPDKQKMAQYIVEGTDTLDRLVVQVLNYSRPLTPNLKETSLKDLLNEWVESIQASDTYNPLHRIDLSSPDVLLPLDAGLFKLALTNLARNAFQAMEKSGTLTIRSEIANGELFLTFSDTGTGIPQEHLKKLFSPFFTTKANGNGLGLAEVHKVVQAHGGEISVESESGQGITFTIKLPLKGS